MKRKRTRAAAAGILAAAALLPLGGCAKEEPEASGKNYIGVAYYNQSDTFLNELLDSFRSQLKDMQGGDMETVVMVRDAAGSQRTQDDQVKELISAGCDILCVNLVDRADPSEIIDLARENEIPIIFFNREVDNAVVNSYDKCAFVGTNAPDAGHMQGEMIGNT